VLFSRIFARGVLSVADKSPSRDIFAPLSGGIAQLVERLVRNENRSGALTFAHVLLSAIS
jgi:hypothetical protein